MSYFKLKTLIREMVNQKINESVDQDNLEMIGSDVSELLDAINRLNGTQMSGKAFRYRDSVKLKPLNKTGHTISKNKFSIEVIPNKLKNVVPSTNEYLRAANLFLEENDFDCKLYKSN